MEQTNLLKEIDRIYKIREDLKKVKRIRSDDILKSVDDRTIVLHLLLSKGEQYIKDTIEDLKKDIPDYKIENQK